MWNFSTFPAALESESGASMAELSAGSARIISRIGSVSISAGCNADEHSALGYCQGCFLHVLFIMLMSISLIGQRSPGMERLLLIFPNQAIRIFNLAIVLFLFCFALCPYVISMPSRFPSCIYHALFAGWRRSGSAVGHALET